MMGALSSWVWVLFGFAGLGLAVFLGIVLDTDKPAAVRAPDAELLSGR